MKNLIFAIIFTGLAYGYVNNKSQVHTMLGITSSSVNEDEKHSGIHYVKLKNVDSLNVGVHLISASWCGYCSKLREIMVNQNVSFTEYNAEDDTLVEKFLNQNGIDDGVPITIIGGDIVYGYDVEKLEKAFSMNNIKISGL